MTANDPARTGGDRREVRPTTVGAGPPADYRETRLEARALCPDGSRNMQRTHRDHDKT